MANISIAILTSIWHAIYKGAMIQIIIVTATEGTEIKTTLRMPKSLIKQLKQYALDNDTTLTAIVIEGCNEFLTKRKKK
ncbi:MAG: hypothetical protein M3044_04425 [Thermoproteota archaeon]|nr:hypothetical protein [Thermoproteota archaeon]